MNSCKFPVWSAALLAAVVGIAALGVSPESGTGIATAHAHAQVRLAHTVGLGMGGSGNPMPSQALINEILYRFGNPDPPFFPGQPSFAVDSVLPLFTPAGMYPSTGVRSLTLDTSIAQGVGVLHNAITGEIAAGNNVVVAGGSQSATIASIEMARLLALPEDERPTADQLSFLLLVDPSNPNGGLLSRFGDPTLPSLYIDSFGIDFSGATPADTPWDTAIYNVEYDGFSDFPRYPLNVLSVLNAVAGIAFAHRDAVQLSDERTAQIVELPVSDDYTGHTRYFMIPTENLPLLELLRFVPILGDPLADLVQPFLRVLVNLGYGNIENGWDPGPANLATPFGLFPADLDWNEVFAALVDGAKQGVNDFAADLRSLSIPGVVTEVAAASAGLVALPGLADLVSAFAGVLSAGYSSMLPLADAVSALTLSLPTYQLELFAHGLSDGDLLGAIGMPIAAGFGLTPVAIGFGLFGLVDVVNSITNGFAELF